MGQGYGIHFAVDKHCVDSRNSSHSHGRDLKLVLPDFSFAVSQDQSLLSVHSVQKSICYHHRCSGRTVLLFIVVDLLHSHIVAADLAIELSSLPYQLEK